MLDLKDAHSTIAVALLLWGVFTLYMWIATFKLTRIVNLVFLTLWVTFFLLGAGGLFAMPAVSQTGGWVGLVCGTLALSGGFAIVTNSRPRASSPGMACLFNSAPCSGRSRS